MIINSPFYFQVDAVSPDVNRPNEGKIEVHVDISPSCVNGFDDKDISQYSTLMADRIQQ
jgi:exosome complex RNA-binding protein Rrp42 (RNase PH superfamily)